MTARLQRIAAERERLLRQIDAGRGRIVAAARSSGRDALTAALLAGAGRWLTRRFRWGALGALALGLAASRIARRRSR